MFGILNRAVFREIGAGAVLGTTLFTIVLFMQRLGSKLFESLLRGSASPETVAWLLALLLPPVLTFSLPLGTLVGVLLGLGRMSSDGEIIAMRAAGVPGRRVLLPVAVLGLVTTAAAAACSIYLTPAAIREQFRILRQSVAQQLTAEIQPRVFEEQFTSSNVILYVQDVKPTASTTAEWRNVFLADLTPPEQRSQKGRLLADAPRVTLAAEALAVPNAAANSIQLSLRGVSSHEVGADPKDYDSTEAPVQDQLLEAQPRSETSAKPHEVMSVEELAAQPAQAVEARIELHRRFALPMACLLLAITGIPLGVSSKKAGKSGAFVVTVALAFVYYMAFISLSKLAQQGRIPVPVGVWLPNLAFALLGSGLLLSLERSGDRGTLAGLRLRADALLAWLSSAVRGRGERLGRKALPRIPLLPGIIDTYVLSAFLFYFAVLLAAFVMMAHVFILFELLSDIFKNGIPAWKVARYHVFLTPMLIYKSAPMSVLAAVLIAFGVLSKNNEVTALKACGVSLYRIAVPVLAAGVGISGALFAFDHYYIPEANRIQDALLNEIKNRPVQTYLRPDRKWIFGQGPRIFYYKYFDPEQKVMVGPNVYELQPSPFALTRHISAENARWEPSLNAWVFQNGWWRDLSKGKSSEFQRFAAKVFDELTEAPGWFLREVRQEQQLNFVDLRATIGELQQAGFDTVRLRVQFHKKFSVPLFAALMALMAVPFAFLTGNRGAMAWGGVSFGIAAGYWTLSRVFEEVGNVNQLPAPVAAWAPAAVFALAGLYLFLRMRS